MKTITLLVYVCFVILCSPKPSKQLDGSQLYRVTIFRWSKNDSGEEQKKIVVIGQDGKVLVDNKPTNFAINLPNFTKAINKFITDERLPKEDPYNGLPKVASGPANGEQEITITIIKLKDYNDEKNFDYNSRYVYKKIKKSRDRNIDVYKYLQSDDKVVLKKILQ